MSIRTTLTGLHRSPVLVRMLNGISSWWGRPAAKSQAAPSGNIGLTSYVGLDVLLEEVCPQFADGSRSQTKVDTISVP
jgi:hypothetical protein